MPKSIKNFMNDYITKKKTSGDYVQMFLFISSRYEMGCEWKF